MENGDNHDTVLGLGASTVALGTALGFALLFIGTGIIQWARKLMGDHEIVEMRHPARSSDEDREATLGGSPTRGPRSRGIARRPLVRNSLLGAVTVLLAPAVVLLRDLGPEQRAGHRGRRLPRRRARAHRLGQGRPGRA